LGVRRTGLFGNAEDVSPFFEDEFESGCLRDEAKQFLGVIVQVSSDDLTDEYSVISGIKMVNQAAFQIADRLLAQRSSYYRRLERCRIHLLKLVDIPPAVNTAISGGFSQIGPGRPGQNILISL